MAAGFTYNLTPEEVKEERYDVETGRRRRGPYKLDTTNLPIGEYLPSFTPIAADLVKKTATVAIRVEVAEKFTSGTTLKVKKKSLAYVGMHIGDGAKGATVNSINKQNANYDELTLSKDLGAAVEAGSVLYEATDVNGTTPKVVANSALFERFKEFFRVYVVPVFTAGGETVYILHKQFFVYAVKIESLFSERFFDLLPAGISRQVDRGRTERPRIAGAVRSPRTDYDFNCVHMLFLLFQRDSF